MQDTQIKCFCCDATVHHTRVRDAWTSDGQHVWVGAGCRRNIDATKFAGFQPHKGGPRLYNFEPSTTRIAESVAAMKANAMPIDITRENFGRYLDAHLIEIHMRTGAWWAIRRNGMTRLWKSQPGRIRVPFKYGLKGYGAVTTEDFRHEGAPISEDDPRFRDLSFGSLNIEHFRIKPGIET